MKRWAILISFIVVLSVAVWYATRPTKYVQLYDSIEPGMTVKEAEEILGPSAWTDRFYPVGPNLPIIWVRRYADGAREIYIELTLDKESRIVDKRIEIRMRQVILPL